MADEPALNLDDIGNADEAEVAKQLERLRNGDVPPPAAEVELDKPPVIVVEPEGSAPPPEKAAEPEPKPAETPPAPTAAEHETLKAENARLKREHDAAYKRLRLLNREAERDETPIPRATETPKPPAYLEDPAENLNYRQSNSEQEIARLNAKIAETERLNTIRSREAEFERVKPDYKQALGYLEQTEIKEWEKSGLATAGIRQLSQAVAAGRRGDSAYKPYADHVAAIAQRADVIELASKDSRDPDDVAMWLVARDTYLTSRRQLVWQGAEATGRNPAEIAYELAQNRGYMPDEGPPPTTPSPTTTAETARARVLQQKEISAATESLSEASSGDGGPQPKVLRNRNQILDLKDNELDALIESGQYKNI